MNRKLLIAICLLFAAAIGALLLWNHYRKPSYEGNLYAAKAYSHNTNQEYDVQVKFEGKAATVYFYDQEFHSSHHTPQMKISKGGFWEMQLDGPKIDDPANIRLIDSKSNLFLYINITDPNFPKP